MKGKVLFVTFIVFIVVSTGFSLADDGDNLWTQRTSMPTSRYGHSVSAVNGKIYAIGGYDFNGFLSKVEEYDPDNDTWTEMTSMPTKRNFFSCCVVNKKIYAIGGYDGDTFLSTVEEYDPATDTWTTKSPMITARWGLSACEVNGKIYVIGGGFGLPGNITDFGTVEEYDPIADTWTTKTDMSTPRHMPSCTTENGKIYATGGKKGDITLSTVEEYDPATDIWTTKSPMTTARWGHAACAVNGNIYAIGGSGDYPPTIFIETIEKYDPLTDTWKIQSSSIITKRRTIFPSCTVNGKIHIIGPSYPGPFSEVYVYDPGAAPTGVDVITPVGFALVQNYPNPFNPATTINYCLDQAGMVKLAIYDLLGHKVATLVEEVKTPGTHAVTWNAKDLASGIYFCRVELGESKVITQKMLLMR